MSEFSHDFAHLRHKPPTALAEARPLVVACAPMRSNINVSRIIRAAGCCGVSRVIACGAAKVIGKIARDGAEQITLEVHRTLAPVLKQLRDEGFKLIALEQATGSHCLYDFRFPRNTALIVGNERTGLSDEELRLTDHVVEIPVYGLPYSHNAATATCIAMYEYCRQFPTG
jgi:tRNA G18 (ribose-2'-O)-methylase SpoU